MNRSLVALTVLCLSAMPLTGGVVIQMKSTSPGDTSGAQHIVMSIAGDRLSMTMQGEGSEKPASTMIFQGDLNRMLYVDHARRNYIALDKEKIEAATARMAPAMQEMEDRLKEMPPEQREMMEKMMEKRMGRLKNPDAVPAKVTKTQETETVAGFPATLHQARRGKDLIREYWVADYAKVDAGQEYIDVMKKMGEFHQMLISTIHAVTPVGKAMTAAGGSVSFDEIAKLGGFPVLTKLYQGGAVKEQTELISVDKTEIDPASFEPPQGYSEQNFSRDR